MFEDVRQRRWRLLPLLALCAFMALILPSAAMAASSYSISGTVTDASGPVNGASVVACDVPTDASQGYYSCSGTTAATGADGSYTIPNLTPGSYFIEVYNSPNANDVDPYYYGDAQNPDTATPVTVSTSTPSATANVALPAAGTISGTVTNTSVGNVQDVDVWVDNAAGNEVGESTTASDGTYSITGLAPGTYWVEFSTQGAEDSSGNPVNVAEQWYGAPGGTAGLYESNAAAVSVTAGGMTTINQALANGAEITGVMTDAGTSTPLGGEVEIDDAATGNYVTYADISSTSTSQYGQSIPAGGYIVWGMPAGDYQLHFDPNGFTPSGSSSEQYDEAAWYGAAGTPVALQSSAATVTSSASATTTASIALGEGGSIGGTVTSGGAPLDGAYVDVYNSQGQEVDGTSTASDGTYQVYGLAPGTYVVQFEPDGSNLGFQFYNDATTFSTATTVTVTAGDETPGINASLSTGGQITGTVENASQAPVDGVEVDLVDANGYVLDTTYTAANGTYTLAGVPAGTYSVEFDPNGTDLPYQAQFYGGSQVLSGSKPVTVTDGATTSSINAVLAAATTPTPVTTKTVTQTVTQTVTKAAPQPTAPTVSSGTLKGLSKKKVTASFKLTEGANSAPELYAVNVKLPKGFSFVSKKLKKDLKISAKATWKLSHGVLEIQLTKAAKSFKVTLKAGAISVTKAIAKSAKRHKIKSETVKLSVHLDTGAQANLSYTVKKPS